MSVDAAGATQACQCRMGNWQSYNLASRSASVRSNGAPSAALPFLLLRCNELHRYAVHGACSTVSLLHARGMLAHHLYGSRHSCWQVLRAQRRPDDLIDLGFRCSALPLAPPRWCPLPVH